jgi:hypothetical protein
MRNAGVTKTGILTVLGVAVVVLALNIVFGIFVTIAVVVGLLVIIALLLLIASKTPFGRRIAEKVSMRLARTRIGKRMISSSLRAQARKAGVKTVDPTGRPLSDVELTLELYDTPETRQIRQQLRGMSPQQRASMLRMLEAQQEALRMGQEPPKVTPPNVRPGFPGGNPARRQGGSGSGRRRRKR